MNLRAKIWFELGGEHIFGPGRAALLEAVEREGSIQAAAAKVGLSYRHAWSMLRASQRRWDRKLIETSRGGVGGGGARLTDAGRALLRAFRRIESGVQKAVQEQQHELEIAGI